MRVAVALFCLLLFFSKPGAFAQTDNTPAYKRFPFIPPFSLIKTDSTQFTRDSLSKNKAVLIMFFSPDCDHCQRQTKDIKAGIRQLQQIQIVMATYQPMENLRKFCADYQLQQFPNIVTGRDATYFLPPFFQMDNLPFMALYDKNFNLITTFEGNHTVAKIAAAFNIPQ